MSVFAEPHVTLCGAKDPSHYAVCCKTIAWDDDGVDATKEHDGDHEFEDMNYVLKKLDGTCTPCKWLHPVEDPFARFT